MKNRLNTLTPREEDDVCNEYLEAVEREDLEGLELLWLLAEMFPQLATAFRQIHDGMAEERRLMN